MVCADPLNRSAAFHVSQQGLAIATSIHAVIIYVKRKVAQRLQLLGLDKSSGAFPARWESSKVPICGRSVMRLLTPPPGWGRPFCAPTRGLHRSETSMPRSDRTRNPRGQGVMEQV